MNSSHVDFQRTPSGTFESAEELWLAERNRVQEASLSQVEHFSNLDDREREDRYSC